MIILVFALLLTLAVIASSPFLNIVEANHNTTPIISTRNHFEPYFGNLNYFAHSRTDYDIISDIPHCSPSRELVIYVHGWDNDKEEAIDKFNIVKKSLSSLGFTQPMIGFIWDSDINWYAAKNAATQNGDKLAQFVLHYKEECPNAEIRLVGHSLGTRIILNTLDSLYNNQLWTERGYKITSVHVMGAAVNPAELSVSSLYFGRPIENVTLSFGNKFSPEDDVLEEVYYEIENHRALGEAGAENMGIYLPSNYVKLR
jgi:esterase/lipase superfamily enzyme